MAKCILAIQAVVLVGLFLSGNVIMAEDMLFNSESLNTNEFLENGPYRFLMQGDCNPVLCVKGNRALWNSATNGRGNACCATLQNNGNLVVLPGNDVVWTSNSVRGPNNCRLIVQGEGNVVIYGAALCATNAVQNNRKLMR